MPNRTKSEKVGTGYYYVMVDGQRWSPICRINEATRYYDRAVKIHEIASGVHTIQLIQILDECMVGRK